MLVVMELVKCSLGIAELQKVEFWVENFLYTEVHPLSD
jgi:hypothetical protein